MECFSSNTLSPEESNYDGPPSSSSNLFLGNLNLFSLHSPEWFLLCVTLCIQDRPLQLLYSPSECFNTPNTPLSSLCSLLSSLSSSQGLLTLGQSFLDSLPHCLCLMLCQLCSPVSLQHSPLRRQGLTLSLFSFEFCHLSNVE